MGGHSASFRGRRRRMMSEINVVPYIDVTLVLLIIFMVTAPMIVTGSIDLPRVGQSAQDPISAIEVIIRKDGSHALRKREQGAQEQPTSKAEMIDRLRQLGPQSGTPIIVMAERDVRYELVAQTLSKLQSAGIGRVGLAVRQE
ncbi:MAG: ExbD/TolR family protein [Betaproteobacteria bacterium]|nr:ExbD/TolR family protein [Betaproteobacteria bacterium]NBT74661.1 ExbD/TolR family protein [Betaproteobacteria bacterium]NBY14054.1 ExbD/TolR family protein [Betaproteobacteria bacterium]NCA15981.1 ExbD/TolR family protein [Betaproteobacteria bacterium]